MLRRLCFHERQSALNVELLCLRVGLLLVDHLRRRGWRLAPSLPSDEVRLEGTVARLRAARATVFTALGMPKVLKGRETSASSRRRSADRSRSERSPHIHRLDEQTRAE